MIDNNGQIKWLLKAIHNEYEQYWASHFENFEYHKLLAVRRRNFQAKLSFLVSIEQLEIFQNELEKAVEIYINTSQNIQLGSFI